MTKIFTAQLTRGEQKGSWTYIATPFNSVEYYGTKGNIKVSGTVDGHPIEGTLMPLGDGTHMLPVKAEIREAIGKDDGDIVEVNLERL
jgi:Domain of unknown function (DUF1905)